MQNVLLTLVTFFPFIFIGFVIFIIVVINLTKMRKLSKQKNNAQSIFEKEGGVVVNIINATENSSALIGYLKSILERKEEKNIVIETSEFNEVKQAVFLKNSLIFLKFECDNESIDILSNPDNLKSVPKTISFKDVDKIILKFRSYSETRGSGKNSRTYYYNQYSTILKFKQEVSCADVAIYNKITYVSQDRGYFEIESRAIGELFAKIFKTNLVRTDGTEIEYTKLDESVTEKLKNFVKSSYSFKKEMFTVEDIGDNGSSINELQYYNTSKIVWGIILFSIIDIVGLILFFKTQPIGREIGPFHNIAIFILIEMLFGLIIFLWVKNSKYKVPKQKPIVHIYKDKIFTDLKIKNGEIVSKNEVLVSKIEEIVVRYEASMGHSVKLVSDDFSVRVVSYSDLQKANYIRDEILNALKNLS